MAGQAVASAFVTIIPEMRGFRQTLSGQVSGAGSSAGDLLGREMGQAGTNSFRGSFALAGAIGGAVATATQLAISAIGGLAREAVKASDATDKFKATLNFAGLDTKVIDDLSKSARAYADQTVYSLSDIQGITAQLAANGVTGFDKLAEAAGNLNAIAGGNAETFGRVGLVVTQVSGAGRLMTQDWNQLVNAIPGASGKLQDALLAAGAYTGNFRDAMQQGQITADEFNAAVMQIGMDPIAVEAAKSTATFEGAIGNLKAAIVGGLSDALNAMKPIITGVINALTAGIDAVNGFVGRIGQIFSSAGGGVAGFTAFLQNITQNVMEWVQSGGLAQAISSIADARTAFFNSILGALPGIIDALVAFIPSFASFVVGTLIPQMVSQFAGIVEQLALTIRTAVPQVLTALAEIIPMMAQSIANMLPGLVTTLLGMIPTLLQTALTVFQSLVDALMIVIPSLITTVIDMLPALVDSIMSMLPSIIESAIALFNGIIEGLIVVIPMLLIAILDALPAIVSAIVQMLPGIIQAAIDLFLGLILGLMKVLPDLLNTIFTDVIPAVIEALIDMLPELINAAVILFVGLVTGISKALPQIIEASRAIVPKLVDALLKLMPQLWDLGWQMLGGLAKGIWDAIPQVLGGIVKGIGDSLIGGVKALFGIKSPSRVFAAIGGYIIDGLANGLNDGADRIQKAVDNIGEIIDTAFGTGGTFDATATVIGAGAMNVPNPVMDYGQVASTMSSGTVNYYAAPNESIDSEQALNIALKRSKVLAAW
jgi:tape measure domain-containing protein